MPNFASHKEVMFLPVREGAPAQILAKLEVVCPDEDVRWVPVPFLPRLAASRFDSRAQGGSCGELAKYGSDGKTEY